jgi:hypothetical protein
MLSSRSACPSFKLLEVSAFFIEAVEKAAAMP